MELLGIEVPERMGIENAASFLLCCREGNGFAKWSHNIYFIIHLMKTYFKFSHYNLVVIPL